MRVLILCGRWNCSEIWVHSSILTFLFYFSSFPPILANEAWSILIFFAISKELLSLLATFLKKQLFQGWIATSS